MASASISGLSSGLDTATIIDQLMQVEAAPQTRLKTRVASEQSVVTTLQTLNTKVATLGSKAEALAKPSAWTPLVSSSSTAGITVTAGTGASPTRATLTVTSVARTHQLGFADGAALTDVVTGGATTVTLDRYDGSPVTLETGDGTLQGLITAINADDTGLRASAVKTSAGGYRLLVESTATGAAQDFDLTRSDGGVLLGGTTVRAGADAAVDLGAGISVTSTSNTFADLLPGLTVTIGDTTAAGAVTTITVSRDTARLSSSVSAFVDAVNGVLSDIDAQTSYNATTSKAGALIGDAGVRSLRSALLESVYPTDGGSLASIGIEVDRFGKLSFDATAFAEAYAADPAGVAARFTTGASPGFAQRVDAVTSGASDPVDGTLTASITGRRAGVTRMNTSIEEWDRRLELRRTTLERQFTALETALNQMSSQSSWLSSQLSSLSTAS